MKFLKVNKELFFKLLFSSVFGVLAFLVVYSDYFSERINFLVIILILLAFLPWIIKYIKYLELNGVGKVELFNEKEQKEINETIVKIETESGHEKANDKKQNDNITEVMSIDENGVNVYDIIGRLFVFRIEIEKEINEMLDITKLDLPLKPTLINKASILYKNGIIKDDEWDLLNQVIPKLNKITHNETDITTDDFWTLYRACKALISSLEFRKGILQF